MPVHLHTHAGVQVHRYTAIQVYRYTGVQVCTTPVYRYNVCCCCCYCCRCPLSAAWCPLAAPRWWLTAAGCWMLLCCCCCFCCCCFCTIVMAKNEDTAVTIRIQRCTCALSAQLPPSTVNVAVMAKARMRATASQPWYHIYHLYTCIPV